MNIYGIGNTLIDMLCYISEDELNAQALHKGTMCLIDKTRHRELLDWLKGKNITLSAGGSAPNTMITLRQLGIQTTLGGGVGNDELGRVYHQKLADIGVKDELCEQVEPTGTSIILLTEDKERTMNTYLGANRCYDDINVVEESVKNADLFYFTGYMWDTEPQKRAVTKVLKICKERNIKVAFDMADPFAVGRYRQTFLKLIEEYCDIVFANSEEARYLFDNYDAAECCKSMGKLCDVAIVKNGIKGSYISDHRKLISVPVSGSSSPVDTTGAGDTYAAGFLYGIAKGYDTEKSGAIASYLAGEIISILGAQFPSTKSAEIKKYLESHF
jgi:Sugar kinases, ribokinase family